MKKYEHVRPATLTDIFIVAASLRESDLREAADVWGFSKFETMTAVSKAKLGETYAITDHEDKAIGLFGFSNLRYEPGYSAWLVGTDDLNSLYFRKNLIRTAKLILQEELRTKYRLSNYCNDNPMLHKFLKTLGFTVSPTINPKIFELVLCA